MSPGSDARSISLEELIKRWNTIPGVVNCRVATEKRKKAFKARSQNRAWVENLDEGLAAVAASAFLRGNNDRNWQAGIDWLLQPDSLTKALEGKYGNGNDRDRVASPAGSSIYAELSPRPRPGLPPAELHRGNGKGHE